MAWLEGHCVCGSSISPHGGRDKIGPNEPEKAERGQGMSHNMNRSLEALLDDMGDIEPPVKADEHHMGHLRHPLAPFRFLRLIWARDLFILSSSTALMLRGIGI
jgi:hypothetical protein